MALEVIGGIASILQLAGTVYTISKTLYEVGEALSNAPSDIKDLARDLETFSDELHLLSTLLHGKDGRYADQVYRLTAKIIGDCATICTKIDRIIRKLRSGSVLAKIKWLYKEKEIMKLLARPRGLKLSLMSTLSVLSALRADNMMDSLGINNPSLIGGPNRHGLSTETRMQVEDTRLKLAGMSMKDTTRASLRSKSLLPSSASLVSGSSSSTLGTSATSSTYVSPPTTRIPSTTSFSTSSFISKAVVPKSMPPILNTHANQSVDSFHSALSYQNQNSQDPETQQSLTPTDPSHALSSPSLSLPQPTPLQGSRYPIAKACNECRKKKRECDGKEPCDQCTSQSGGGDRLEDCCAYGPLEKDSGLRDGDVNPTDEQTKQVESFLEPEDLSHVPVIPRPVMAKHLPIPNNLSATIGPTSPAVISPQPQIENKDQEFEKDRLGADSKEQASPVGNPAGIQASMGFAYLKTSTSGSDDDEPAYLNFPLPSATQKLQSSTRGTQRIQIRHQQQKQQQQQQQQQQQIQQQVTWLSARQRSSRVVEVNFELSELPWHKVDACQSKEISANRPLGLYGLENEDLLPKTQPQEILLLNQASQETYKRDGQPYGPSISPCGKSERRGRMELPPDYTDDTLRQDFKLPKIDQSNNDSTIHFQNEVSNKGPGGFWVRGFINVKSFDAVIWSNLEHYLKWQRVYTTSEAGSIPLVANLDWSATLYKERIALRRQMFPHAASSIQKILDVLAVMEETIGLKIGAIAWACLLGAVENLLSLGTNLTADSQIRIITEMCEIASIIARYTVMENIYSQWKGMSLDKDYEQSLINLSTHVLIYLGAFVPSLSESSTNADMKPYFDRIIEADMACRGFTVIVSSKNTAIDRKRSIEEFSDDSDDTVDSDGTILGVDGNDELNGMPSSAKRTKI
ncbi:hypothetical protein BTUL_0145g00200 [Botrytis tulipae]|uniref:Zn(2)-C6 fungal-type domain-containing protein n=1 Tax=Botrytis tulipae TaxID=87230 RepID=A0A4Z1EI34_9HELO|nr:hypothetical protein BTUL_0145g00200 [Botrytis tulipae]